MLARVTRSPVAPDFALRWESPPIPNAVSSPIAFSDAFCSLDDDDDEEDDEDERNMRFDPFGPVTLCKWCARSVAPTSIPPTKDSSAAKSRALMDLEPT